MSEPSSLTVIIVTVDRPGCLQCCLEHLAAQTRPVEQILVVDGSSERSARPVAVRFADCQYIHNAEGFGRMTYSRNLGLLEARGEVVAYLDDDAYADPHWAEQILQSYENLDIGAVGGRALNNGEADTSTPASRIGRVLPDGTVTGGFAADPGAPIEVDHLIGCNMSFRRSTISALGGFHEFYADACCTYEEVDLCMRLQRQGHRLLFSPTAVVDHVAAPRQVGERFNAPYVFGVTRNHCTCLLRNWGPGRPAVWLLPLRVSGRMSYVLTVRAIKELGKLALKGGAVWGGACRGLTGGLRQRLVNRQALSRDDAMGRRIRRTTSQPEARQPATNRR